MLNDVFFVGWTWLNMKIAEAMRMFFSGWSWFVKPLWSKVGGRMWKAIAFLESCNVWDGLETIPTSKHMFFFRWRFPSCKQPNGDRFPFFAIHPLVTWGVLRNFRLIIRSVSWQIIKSHCVKLVSQYPNLDFLWVAKQIRNMKKPSKKPTIAEKNSKIFWDPMMTAITDSKMHFPHFDCLFSAGLAGVHHDVVHLCLLRPNGWFRGPQWRDPKWCHSSGQAASISIPSPSHLHQSPEFSRKPGVTSRTAWSPSSPWPHWATGRSKCGTWPSIHRWRPWCRSSPSSSWPSAA